MSQGKAMSDEERRNRSIFDLTRHLTMFIRKDYGGHNPVNMIQDKCSSKGWDILPYQAEIILDLIDDQLNGCRMRQSNTIDDINARAVSIDKLINGTGEVKHTSD